MNELLLELKAHIAYVWKAMEHKCILLKIRRYFGTAVGLSMSSFLLRKYYLKSAMDILPDSRFVLKNGDQDM